MGDSLLTNSRAVHSGENFSTRNKSLSLLLIRFLFFLLFFLIAQDGFEWTNFEQQAFFATNDQCDRAESHHYHLLCKGKFLWVSPTLLDFHFYYTSFNMRCNPYKAVKSAFGLTPRESEF